MASTLYPCISWVACISCEPARANGSHGGKRTRTPNLDLLWRTGPLVPCRKAKEEETLYPDLAVPAARWQNAHLVTIGILAYGSLIPDPGAEIGAVTVSRITGVETPFRIEFSRSSRVRDGAPTLVPVDRGGARVSGVVLALRDSVTETAAQDMLYRRERNRVGSSDVYAEVDPADVDSAFLDRLEDFAELDVVFHAALRANIAEPTPELLARLAIASAAAPSGATGRDGIRYLMDARQSGIVTPLMGGYEREVLRRTGARDLEEAHAIALLPSGAGR